MKQYGFSMGQDPMCFSELPEFLHSTFVEAHRSGRLPETLSHYIGTLDGLGALDSASLQALKDARRQVTGGRKADEKILPDIIKIVDGLKPAKRR